MSSPGPRDVSHDSYQCIRYFSALYKRGVSLYISGGDKGLTTMWTLNLIHNLESVSFPGVEAYS